MVAAQLNMLVKTKLATNAGACIAVIILATIQHNVALKSKFLAKKHAADTAISTMKYNAANMFLSTTLKHAAAKFLSTMKLMIANAAKNMFATHTANMFLNTTGNISVVTQHAQHHALQAVAQDNSVLEDRRINRLSFFTPPQPQTLLLGSLGRSLP